MRHAHSERWGFISMRHATLLPLLAVFLLSVAPVLKAQSSTAYCDQYARSYAQQYGANGRWFGAHVYHQVYRDCLAGYYD